MAESVSVLAVTIRDGINWRDADGGKAALAALEALLARLTAAEQERDQWEQECERRSVFNSEVAAACDAAEARVEAAERERDEWQRLCGEGLEAAESLRTNRDDAHQRLADLVKAVDSENFNRPARAPEMSQALRIALRDARAALACPPQQRGE